jgi:hypothetical protein
VALTFAKGQVATFSTGTVTSDPDPALDDCAADKGGTVTGNGTIQMTGRNVGELLSISKASAGAGSRAASRQQHQRLSTPTDPRRLRRFAPPRISSINMAILSLQF